MNEVFHIMDEKLPTMLDFKKLKKEGLSFINEFDGVHWTNLNPSDPGVTVLDQIVFALTELGYCTDFPVKDLLTQRNGKIKFKNQFYQAQEILTSSPVQAQDYIKFLLDRTQGHVNAQFVVPKASKPVLEVIEAYLDVDSEEKDLKQKKAGKKAAKKVEPEVQDPILDEVFFLLNRVRNVGQLFAMPQFLQPVMVQLNGSIVFKEGTNLQKALGIIEQAIKNYLFPKIQGKGYQELQQMGYPTNEIFNGPKLQHGWIVDQSLPVKRNQLTIGELIAVLSEIKEVSYVESLSFAPPYNTQIIKVDAHQILQVAFSEDHLSLVLEPTPSSVTQQKGIFGTGPLLRKSKGKSVSTVEMVPKKPKGNFRDIETYFSIQQTFPEIFGVGADAIGPNTNPIRIAQTRQLKGYLSLYDQVLANQFSQIANLGTLFSFKNATKGLSKEVKSKNFFIKKFEKPLKSFPVPYKTFVATYFYQFLYDVPDIEAILKDHGIFNFSTSLLPKKTMEVQSWEQYKEDPYNRYALGLMHFTDDESISLKRRNTFLNHLLARHGESPSLIDGLMGENTFTGEKQKDRILIKSLLLQNLGQLSYHRFKGYNYLQASQIQTEIQTVTIQAYSKMAKQLQRDFLMASKKINKKYKLKQKDFTNYSGLELQLNLLWALDFQYQKFIVAHYGDPAYQDEIGVAQWMRKNRKGVILVETKLLLSDAVFQLTFASKPDVNTGWRATNLTLSNLAELEAWFRSQKLCPFLNSKGQNEASITVNRQTFVFERIQEHFSSEDTYLDLGYHGALSLEAQWGSDQSLLLPVDFLETDLWLVFPGFLPLVSQASFRSKMQLFFENLTPVRMQSIAITPSIADMKNIIPLFANWHNAKRFQGIQEPEVPSKLEPSKKWNGGNENTAKLVQLLLKNRKAS